MRAVATELGEFGFQYFFSKKTIAVEAAFDVGYFSSELLRKTFIELSFEELTLSVILSTFGDVKTFTEVVSLQSKYIEDIIVYTIIILGHAMSLPFIALQ